MPLLRSHLFARAVLQLPDTFGNTNNTTTTTRIVATSPVPFLHHQVSTVNLYPSNAGLPAATTLPRHQRYDQHESRGPFADLPWLRPDDRSECDGVDGAVKLCLPGGEHRRYDR